MNNEQIFRDVLTTTGLQQFIEWLFTASDAELNAIDLEGIFKTDEARAQLEKSYDAQLKEFQDDGLIYDDVVEKMRSIISDIEDITQEMNNIPEKEVSAKKKQVLSVFFGLFVEMAQRIINEYPRENATVYIELIDPNAKVPEYKSLFDAGADVYSPKDYVINPGETLKLNTGFKVSIPNQWKLSVRPRSGLSLNTKMRIANAPGTIDPNYLDEVGILIDNIGTSPVTISAGERPCQLVLERRYTAKFVTVSNVDAYASGNRGGGFGHTGS